MESSLDILIPMPWGHISGKTFGSPTGHKVLIVHGFSDNLGTFDRLIPLLSKDLYVVCIELPGHGQSSHLPPGTAYNQIECVVYIRRVINYLKWTTFDYIGHSLGGSIGSLYAAIFPLQVDRLIMIDVLKFPSWADDSTLLNYAKCTKEFLALDGQRNGALSLVPYSLSALCEIYGFATDGILGKQEAEILLKRGGRQLEPNTDSWALTRDVAIRNTGFIQMSHASIFEVLSGIRCKMLLIKAIDSDWAEPEKICRDTMDIYKANCKTYQFIEVPGNHYIPLTNPTGIAPHINHFLTANR